MYVGEVSRVYTLLFVFEYRLCRRIKECDGGDIETLFKAVCLYIALKNETKEGAEFLALSEAKTPHEAERSWSETPILDELLGGEARNYIQFCKTLKNDADRIRLLFGVADTGKRNKYDDKEIWEELKNTGVIKCTYQNFNDKIAKKISPNILTKFRKE